MTNDRGLRAINARLSRFYLGRSVSSNRTSELLVRRGDLESPRERSQEMTGSDLHEQENNQ